MKKRPPEEIIKFHTDRIREDHSAQKQFFSRAIKIQNDQSNYDPNYLKEKLDIACNTLATVNFCTRTCDNCPLQGAHQKALKEIEEGVRTKPNKKNYIPWKRDYYLEVSVNPKTGVVTQVLTPIKVDQLQVE